MSYPATQKFSDLLELTHKELVAHLGFYNFSSQGKRGNKLQLAARLLDHLEDFGQTPDVLPSRTYLMVPYRCRRRARALGAYWDPIWKSWYVPAYSRNLERLTQEYLLRSGQWDISPKFTRAEWEQHINPQGSTPTSSVNGTDTDEQEPLTWDHLTRSSSAPATLGHLQDTSMTLHGARELTKLNRLKSQEAFNIFLAESNGLRPLSKGEYNTAFWKIINQVHLPESQRDPPFTPHGKQQAETIVEQLFHSLKDVDDDCLDYDDDHLIRYLDIVFAISILIGGTREEKIAAVFKQTDTDMGSHRLSRDTFQRYLTAVFKTLFIVQPEVVNRVGVSPNELAKLTVDQLFRSGELASDNQITLEECQRWYQIS